MRTLPNSILQVNDSLERSYRYQVVIWDVMSPGAPTLGQIIQGTADTSFMLDVTAAVNDGMSLEEPGDRRASRLTFILTADTDAFNPVGGANARWLRDGQFVRLREGDDAVPQSDWIFTFSGHIRGQVGFVLDRQAVTRSTEVSAYGRRGTSKYNKMPFTSKNFGRLTDYGTIVLDIAQTVMGLTLPEISRINAFLRRATQFASSQIVDLTPLEAIDKILEAVGQVSDFDGEGILRTYSRDVTRGVDRQYVNLALVQSVRVPAAEVHAYNSVSVVGLDKNITETEHPGEELARATISAGFWRPRERVSVQWSDDRSVRASDTTLEIITSIRDALILGGFGSEQYNQLDDFSGEIVVDISGYVGTLLILIVVGIAANALIGDLALPFGGLTIPIGKILEGVVLKLITTALATSSTGQYMVRGTVLIPVFKELSVVVTESGVPDFLLNQREIKNDWLNEQTELLDIATLELMFEHAQAEPREVAVLNDLAIEIGDIVFIPIGGGLRLWVDSFRKTIARGTVPIMQIDGYRAL